MGIFQDQVNLYARYQGRIKFRSWLMGATPMRPKMIEAWLRKGTGLIDNEAEIRAMMLRTLLELGADVHERMTLAQLDEAAEAIAAEKHTVGFKRTPEGELYIEGRILKACLRECVNIIFAGDAWGPTRKGAKNYFVERVFVDPDVMGLSVMAPTGVELIIGHVSGPKGPQSNITYHEYVDRPEITFEVSVTQDAVPLDAWPYIWEQAQNIGLGALRSQGYGRFDIEEWEPLGQHQAMPRFTWTKPGKGGKDDSAA